MDENNRNVTDWELFVICQQSTKEKLRCPADSIREDKSAGYKILTENLKHFADLHCLPFSLERLGKKDAIVATFLKQKARYHKNCYDRFNARQLKRTKKKKVARPR